MEFLSTEMPGPGRSPFPTIGMSASWKASLWTRIEKLTDHICKIYGQVIVEIRYGAQKTLRHARERS